MEAFGGHYGENGFSLTEIHLVILCVSSVTYSFKLNGEPVGYIQPGRGIRQGYPLSPYLFVMCALQG